MLKAGAAVAPAKQESELARRPIGAGDVMRSLSTEMDRMFTDFGLRRRWPFAFLAPESEELLWSPEIEVEEREGKLFVRADLPGLTKNDVKVEVTDDALTIEGERKHSEQKEEKGYYRSERSYGRFLRTIALPEGADANSAKAEFKDGVLEVVVTLPPVVAPQTRKVDIA